MTAAQTTALLRDCRTLIDLGPITEDDIVYGRFALRLDVFFQAPLHRRPAALGPYLTRAAEIMGPALAFYAAEEAFHPSAGRKTRKDDLARLAEVDSVLKADFDRTATELAERRTQIEAATGQPTYDHHFVPVDAGNLYMGDAPAPGDSETHIMMSGTGAWSLSLSFGPSLVRDRAPDILALAQDIMTSGLPASGLFGFALNMRDLPPDIDNRLFLPPTRRFAMLNPIEARIMRFDRRFERGLAPIGCWTVLEDRWAAENGLDPEDLDRRMAGLAAEVVATSNGRLFKLWEVPTLADRHGAKAAATDPANGDLAPAAALGAALAPAMDAAHGETPQGAKDSHGLPFLRVGSSADRWNFYMRFKHMARNLGLPDDT